MECGELLYGRRFPLKLKGTAYMSYVRPEKEIHGGGIKWQRRQYQENKMHTRRRVTTVLKKTR